MQLARGVKLVDAEDGVIVFDAKRGKYWHLNKTGYLVVTRLLAGQSLHAISSEIESQSQVDHFVVLSDCQSIATHLVDSGLLVEDS